MIGVFKSNKHLERAFEKIKRPGERIEVESQIFDTPERAVGAIQGRGKTPGLRHEWYK